MLPLLVREHACLCAHTLGQICFLLMLKGCADTRSRSGSGGLLDFAIKVIVARSDAGANA